MPLTIPEYIEVKTAAGATAAYLSPEADGLKDVLIDRELNGRCTLTLSLPLTSAKWQYLSDAYRVYAPDITGQMREFIILNPDAIEKVRNGRKVWGKITAHESWVRLGKEFVVPEGISNDPQTPSPPALAVVILSGGSDLSGGLYTVGSAGHALYAILQGTGWSVGTVDVTGIHDLETEKISILASVQKVQETWGGYLLWDSVNKIVHLRDETLWAPYTGYQIRYAKNEKRITRNDDYDIITKLYPFGADDLDIGSVNSGDIYITNNSYTAEVLTGIWVNQDIQDPQELKDKGEEYLAKVCKPRHNYRAKHVDLRLKSGYQHEDYDLGHLVDLIDEELSFDDQARIISYRFDIFQPWNPELEVGDPIEKIDSMIENSQAMVQYLNAIKTSRGQITAYKLVDDSIIKQKIASAAVDATKLDTNTVILLGDTWADNNPASGSVSWNQHKLYYAGTEYIITAGNTSLKYIYWDGVSNTYSASATEPELTDGQFYIAVNNEGLHDLVWNSPTARKFIGSLFIADAAIKTAHIDDLAVTDAKIASLTANKITTGQLLSYLVEVVGKNGYFRINGDEFQVYNKSGQLLGRFGHYETLAEQIATFTRASVAYKLDGSSVASGIERYEYARIPGPVWEDIFDTDSLAEYTSGGDPATWAIADGVLTGTGGTQATLIKNNLLLRDMEIEINSDQAQDGGIVARWQDANNYYLLALRDDSGEANNLQLYKCVGGSLTSLDTADVAWTRGTSKLIKFTLHGSRLEAWFDGAKVISVTDTALSGGSAGLLNNNATAFQVLDFKVYYASQGVMVEEATAPLVLNPFFSAYTGTINDDTEDAFTAWTNYTQGTGRTEAVTGDFGGVAFKATQTAATAAAQYRGVTQTRTLAAMGLAVGDKISLATKYKMSAQTDCTARVLAVCRDAGGSSTGVFYLVNDETAVVANYTVKKLEEQTIPANTVDIDFRAHLRSSAAYSGQNNQLWVDYFTCEKKAYCTSPTDVARVAEVLTVPTAGVFAKDNWAVELDFTPTSEQVVTGRYARLWECYIDADNRYSIMINPLGVIYGSVKSGGAEYTTWTASNPVAAPGSTYRVMLAGNGANLTFCVNGVQYDETQEYVEPVGALPSDMYIGSTGTGSFGNGLFSDFRVSNRARTLAQHQADYNTGEPLSVDEYTTYLMSCDGTLQPTEREFGLYSAAGKIVGNIISGSTIFGSTVKSCENINDSTYIALIPPNVLRCVRNGNTVLEIVSGGNAGVISLFDSGNEVACLHGNFIVDGADCAGLMTDEAVNLAMFGMNGLNSIVLRSNGRINYTSGGSYGHYFYGNLRMGSGTKYNIEQTENYGKRSLSVVESPEQLYTDAKKAQLVNGECKIVIDPIFLECIEPNTDDTPWLIHLTPYADAGLYVAEIGADYFVVRERNGGTSNAVFVWSMLATRINHAFERLLEVI